MHAFAALSIALLSIVWASPVLAQPPVQRADRPQLFSVEQVAPRDLDATEVRLLRQTMDEMAIAGGEPRSCTTGIYGGIVEWGCTGGGYYCSCAHHDTGPVCNCVQCAASNPLVCN